MDDVRTNVPTAMLGRTDSNDFYAAYSQSAAHDADSPVFVAPTDDPAVAEAVADMLEIAPAYNDALKCLKCGKNQAVVSTTCQHVVFCQMCLETRLPCPVCSIHRDADKRFHP